MKKTRKLVYSGVCLALCMLLPFLTGQVPYIGQMLSPMHIPVLICGFVCGPIWGALVGLLAPSLRFVLFGAPPIMPMGISMTFELVTYGVLAGIIYSKNGKKRISIFVALIIAMIFGRLVWGSVMAILAWYHGWQFTIQMFFSQAFITALPGIVLQCLVIPPIIILVKKRA